MRSLPLSMLSAAAAQTVCKTNLHRNLQTDRQCGQAGWAAEHTASHVANNFAQPGPATGHAQALPHWGGIYRYIFF